MGKEIRGGAHRTAVKPYCRESLQHRLHKHIKVLGTSAALDLGVYERLRRTRAPNAKGLLHCFPLAYAIVEEVSEAEVHYSDMKYIFTKLIEDFPDLKPKNWCTDDVYAGSRAERVLTILKHLRIEGERWWGG